MPGFDGTGPLGQGSRTGRGLGNCYPKEGVMYGKGIGFRRGGGFGRGYGKGLFCRGVYPYQQINRYSSEITKEEELRMLKEDSSFLKNEMEAISRRINDLENQSE